MKPETLNDPDQIGLGNAMSVVAKICNMNASIPPAGPITTYPIKGADGVLT